MAAGVVELTAAQAALHGGLVLALAGLCTLAGAALYERCVKDGAEHTPALRLGAGFALGHSLLLALWRIGSTLSGEARLSLYASLLLLGLCCLVQRRVLLALLKLPALRRGLGSAVLVLIIVEVVVAAIWLRLYDGSDHSPLYGASIAGQIVATGKIPVLGLHYGQSMLSAAVALLARTNAHNLSLHLFLSLSVFMLAVMTYGALRTYRFGRGMSVLGAFLLMSGNYALTLVHGVSFSTLSPMLICGYTDDILAVSTFLLFVLWLDGFFTPGAAVGAQLAVALVCPAVLAASWNLTAPQNLVTGFAILGLLPPTLLIRRSPWLKRSLLLLLVFVVCFVGASQLGGPYSIKSRQDPNFHSAAAAHYGFKPEIPFAVARTAIAPLWHIRPPFDGEYPVFKLWQLEENFWSGLRLCFYPLAGLVLLGLLLHREGQNAFALPLRRFLIAASITFVTGFALTFALDIQPFDKWGLNKFLTSSLTLGMLALVAAFRLLLARSGRPGRRHLAVALAVALITAPPLLSVGTAVYHSLTAPQHMETMPQRVASLAR